MEIEVDVNSIFAEYQQELANMTQRALQATATAKAFEAKCEELLAEVDALKAELGIVEPAPANGAAFKKPADRRPKASTGK